VIRSRQVRLNLNKSQFQHCQQLSQESARVWNTVKNFFWRTYLCVPCAHQYGFESQLIDGRVQRTRHRKKGIWLSEASMKRYIASRFGLHSQSIQAVIEKFYDNLNSAGTLRHENPKIRYPYKTKNWYCVHWKKSAIQVSGRYIQLSNGKGRQGIIFKLPKYFANLKPICVELIWRNGYWLSITLDIEGKQQILGFNTAAVSIETALEPENQTSKTCPKCGNKCRPKGRNYDCQNPECTLKMHKPLGGVRTRRAVRRKV